MGPALSGADYTHSVLGLAMLAVAGLGLIVGLWVVYEERGRRVSRSFLASTIAMAAYLVGHSFMVRAEDAEVALFWARFAYLGVPFIIPSIYHFSMHLLGLWKERGVWIRTTWEIGFLYSSLALLADDLLVEGVARMPWGYTGVLTLWNVPFFLWAGVIMVMASRDYWQSYREASPVQQTRIQWLALPLLLGTLSILNYAPSLFGIALEPWGYLTFPLFFLGTARVVARYHFPDLTPAFAAGKILGTMSEPVLVVDEGGRVAFINRAGVDLLGWPSDAAKGRHLSTLVGDHAAERMLTDVDVHGEEMVVHNRSGSAIDLAVSTTSLEIRRWGKQKGAIIVARDIRERKRAEERLQQREQHFRALTEHAQDVTIILNGDGTIRYMSPSARTGLGCPPRRGLGTHICDRVHPKDCIRLEQKLQELTRNSGQVATLEVRLEHGEGGYRTFHLRAHSMLDHPAVEGIVVNGRDVTGERELAAQLQHAQKMEAVGRLAGGVAHDFNNILTAIQGNVALIREGVGEAEVQAELDEVQLGAERAARLTDQLLSFSRRQVVQLRALNVADEVSNIHTMLRRIIGERIELLLHIDEDTGSIKADRGQLEQILLNLAVNARDAMGGAGVLQIAAGNVDVGEATPVRDQVMKPGRYVRLTVTDDGSGMDESTMAQIFEPFFTTKKAGEGTGLGLATVYGAVRQANGFIEVESEIGLGTTVRIYFPRVARPKASSEPDTSAAPHADEVAEAVILVVEDEEPVRRLVARVLERKGYTVMTAESGENARAVVAAHGGPIDLLVSDLVMPGMTGREVADWVTAEYPDCATLLMSGYTEDEVARDGIRQGEYAFMPKPFTPGTLESRVREALLERSRAA